MHLDDMDLGFGRPCSSASTSAITSRVLISNWECETTGKPAIGQRLVGDVTDPGEQGQKRDDEPCLGKPHPDPPRAVIRAVRR